MGTEVVSVSSGRGLCYGGLAVWICERYPVVVAQKDVQCLHEKIVVDIGFQVPYGVHILTS